MVIRDSTDVLLKLVLLALLWIQGNVIDLRIVFSSLTLHSYG